jgi:hypothetical protein
MLALQIVEHPETIGHVPQSIFARVMGCAPIPFMFKQASTALYLSAGVTISGLTCWIGRMRRPADQARKSRAAIAMRSALRSRALPEDAVSKE